MTATADPLDSARRLMELLKGAVGGQAAQTPSDESGDCRRWCPVCQAAAVLRGERPEVTAALADVLTATATALHAFAAAPDAPPSAHGRPVADPAAPQDGEPPSEDPPPVVQRIDIA